MNSSNPQNSHEPVVVFITSSAGEMEVAKSMLQAGDISFITRGERNHDPYGGAGNLLMDIRVEPRDVEFAREILKELDPELDQDAERTSYLRRALWVIAIVVLLAMGLGLLGNLAATLLW
ncbi:MAG: hypothetical protein FWC54_06050 [Actinomycetia bacterium]|nr:hypothetical protein [Actinomycetes bacterium]